MEPDLPASSVRVLKEIQHDISLSLFWVKRILETKLSLAEDGESVTSQMT